MSAIEEVEGSVDSDLITDGDELMSAHLSGGLLLFTALVALGSIATIVSLLLIVAVFSL